MERLHFQGAAGAIDDYVQYRRIVGEDDGGKMFTPEEYEAYKKTVLPMRAQNRLFVSWRSPTGIDCKLVGPETPCFCTHRIGDALEGVGRGLSRKFAVTLRDYRLVNPRRSCCQDSLVSTARPGGYKQHKTDFKELPKDRPILLPCKVSKCPCKSYHYAPLNGSQPIRCRCKHFADDHSVTGSYNCTKCSNCSGFHSSFTCGCSQPAYAHDTVVETKEERQALGKPVGHDVPYAAMGGLTGFSSLADGYMRLDESGIGAPSKSFLEAPDDGGSHPFLRAYGPPSSNVKELPEGNNQTSSLKTSEEQDMAYFERRYQERLQKEREQKRLPKDPKHSRNQRP